MNKEILPRNNFPFITVSKLKNSKNIFTTKPQMYTTKYKDKIINNKNLRSCRSYFTSDDENEKMKNKNKLHCVDQKSVIALHNSTIVYIKNSNDNVPSSRISTYIWSRTN